MIMSESEKRALRSAIRGGMRDENALANLVFFQRHPERHGRLISRDERDFGSLSREWVIIRDTLVRPLLRNPGPSPQASHTNLVLVSGGPGLYDDRDVEHDKSWANYVTPPLLLSDTPAKRSTFVGGASEVWWLIYRPPYLARWSDDAAARRASVSDVRHSGFDSYTTLLEARAQARGWRLAWFQSADDMWARFGTFRDKIIQVWFWGHARNDLWLTLAHSTSSVPVRPAASAVVTAGSIAANARLRSSFGPGPAHRFVGCNTAAFAQEWSRVFGVAADGVEGKVDFSAIHATGGEPSLVGPARWRRSAARVPQPVP
jgi:hypothetical protein